MPPGDGIGLAIVAEQVAIVEGDDDGFLRVAVRADPIRMAQTVRRAVSVRGRARGSGPTSRSSTRSGSCQLAAERKLFTKTKVTLPQGRTSIAARFCALRLRPVEGAAIAGCCANAQRQTPQ